MGDAHYSAAHRADPPRRARRGAMAFGSQCSLPRCRIYPSRHDPTLALPLTSGIFLRIYS